MNRVRYGAVLNDAWHGLWHQWGLWRFLLIYFAALIPALIVPLAGFIALVLLGASAWNWAVLAVAGALLVVSFLVVAVLGVLETAGAVWMGNFALEGGTPRALDGWRRSQTPFWRLLGLYAVVWIAGLALGLLAVGGFVLALLPVIRAGDSPSGSAVVAMIAGFCGLYVVILVMAMAATILLTPFLWSALGAIIIDRAGPLDAFRQGWWAIRHRFKESVLTGLMLFGIAYGYQTVVSWITQGVMYIFILPPTMMASEERPPEPVFFVSFALGLFVVMAITTLASLPSSVFVTVGWVSFYRQLTGRTTPATMAAPVPMTPHAPATPAVSDA
ncbi:MAG: hypothetical protein HY876_03430 [Coriobacteriales bacterium]|nr:hypothetical protein [Coriobacteriales bacterium]